MKMMKLAVLPVAIAGVLASNAAFAGSEACFEVYTQNNDGAIDNWAVPYEKASCVAADLATPKPAKIAYELTKNLPLDLGDVNGVGAAGKDMQIVYIPTTDIPGGTVIAMTLSGAVFNGNSGQIHLMKADGSTVASTDDKVDGVHQIKFVTKAGVTIGAGTRLVLTKSSTLPATSVPVPIGIKIANGDCASDTATTSAKVTIVANSAITDGEKGYSIKGGASSPAEMVDMSAQFTVLDDVKASVGQVNAESSDSAGNAIVARTEFVYNTTAHTLEQQQYQIVTPVKFINRVADLDRAVSLGDNDRLEQKFWAANNIPTANVKAGIYSTVDASKNVNGQVSVDDENDFATIAGNVTSATAYGTLASDVFEPGTTTLYYAVENTQPDAIMNFNYQANVDAVLNFQNPDYLDHCGKSTLTHDIKVNGAVLKVPYTFDSNNTWVRITNESSEAAEITMDIFDESGNEAKVVPVGSVGKKSSVVLQASDLVAKAKAAGMNTDGKRRYTMTFTVTAPMNTVHGVSVQKIPGGVDRVVPVLDENNWKM